MKNVTKKVMAAAAALSMLAAGTAFAADDDQYLGKTQDIIRAGTYGSVQGPAQYRPREIQRRLRNLRARRALQLAHASGRTDAGRHDGRMPHRNMGWRRDARLSRRRNPMPARSQALARSFARCGDDARIDMPVGRQRQRRQLDGARHRRAVSKRIVKRRQSAAARLKYTRAARFREIL